LATIRWAARSMIPYLCATSQERPSGNLAIQSSTSVWLLRDVQSRLLALGRNSYRVPHLILAPGFWFAYEPDPMNSP
jgi:hypothetical protein